ncbi:MAG: DUF2231 domain-containing protein [Burkholderiaceae bacterium]
MRTPASIAKHPIHPMLVVFPIGLWIFSLICDLIGLSVAMPAVWHTVAFYTMVGGVVGALLAAVPGLIDLVYYKGGTPPVKKLAVTHMVINLVAVVLYLINIWIRAGNPTSMKAPIILSIIGVCMIAVSGWLGGQMVHVYGVGVEGRE